MVLTLLAGIIVLSPHLDFQDFLAQGDHGRDLYSFKRTAEGAIPYRDYWTQNGPVMPYYYAVFYHIFGISIQSTLMGFYLLILLSGMFIYLICASSLDPPIAFACAVWYWAFRGTEFFYTYNHNGAVLLMLVTIYCLVEYIKRSENRYVYAGAVALLGTILIRPDIGVACLAAFFITLGLTDLAKRDPEQKRKLIRYIAIALVTLSVTFLIYRLLTSGLPEYVRSNELAYWKYAKWSALPNSLLTLKRLLIFHLVAGWPQRAFSILLLITFVRSIQLLRRDGPLQKTERVNLSLVLVSLLLFTLFTLAEFLLSGIGFRIYWILCPLFIFIFFIIGVGVKSTDKIIPLLLAAALLTISSIPISKYQAFIAACKIPADRLEIGANKVYLSPAQQPWIKTVSAVTDFIKTHTSNDAKIFAFPYDPIYYFLSGRNSAMRELIFFGNIGTEEENIAHLEAQQIKYILLSNRALRPVEGRLGIFGQTYGTQYARYLQRNFEVVATFGPWESRAGWVTNHAVRIYARKSR